MTIVILGATGMLGGTLYRFFKRNADCTIIGTARRTVNGLVHFDAREGFTTCPIDFSTVDYVINCIGITKPYCHDERLDEVKNAVYINAFLPYLLAEQAEAKSFRVIQIATDCVFSGKTGGYHEESPHDPTDMYGRTKSMGEVMTSSRFLNIRCSIIGPEEDHKAFLLEWFLTQQDGATVNGFSHHRWNGVTTLQFAQLCKEIIFKQRFDALVQQSRVHHFVPNGSVTKYELLQLLNEVFEKKVTVKEFRGTDVVDRVLTTRYDHIARFYPQTTVKAELRALKDFQRLGEFVHHTTCRFCGSAKMDRILDFGNVPLAGAFLKESQMSSEKFYPLKVHFCEDCALVQVNNIPPAETLFKNYFYFSSKIMTLVDHCAGFARDVSDRFLHGRANPSVFEIGCNDGVMLKPFAQLGIRAVGMDPASNVVASVQQDNFTIIDDFFGRESAVRVRQQHGQFDAITSSYSFAHIDDMRSVMDGVKLLLKDDGVFVFEVYYLGTLLDEMQYDMIYHEHMSYYSFTALSRFLSRYGMEFFDVQYTPGVRSGAVRFYARNIGKRSDSITDAIRAMQQKEREEAYERVETYLDYGKKVERTRAQLLTLLDDLKRQGKTIIGYGASGRGTTIMNYCGIDRKYLDYVVDDAPAKHGFSTPGTHVPIHPWSRVEEGPRPDYALLFAWSFASEVVAKRAEYLRAGGKFIVPLPEVRIIDASAVPIGDSDVMLAHAHGVRA